jgi:hypothetical protein
LRSIRVISYLYSSEEVQLFVRGPEDFLKIITTVKGASWTEIAGKYREMFCGDFENVSDASIAEHENRYKNILAKLRNFEGKCRKITYVLEDYIRFLDKTVGEANVVNDKYKAYGGGLDMIPQRNTETNPYKAILRWTLCENLNFEAMLQMLRSLAEIRKAKEKISEKVESEEKSLAKAQSGKKSLVQLLKNKNNETFVADLEKSLADLKAEAESIELVEKIATYRIVQIYIPTFALLLKSSFSSMLSTFIETFASMSDFLLEQLNEISKLFT